MNVLKGILGGLAILFTILVAGLLVTSVVRHADAGLSAERIEVYAGVLGVIGLGVALSILCLRKPREKSALDEIVESTFLARSLAILSILTFYLPLLGLFMAVAAVCLNFKVRGWSRILSWIALGVSLPLHMLIAVLYSVMVFTRH